MSLSNLSYSLITLALHFSKTIIKVLMAATAVATSDSDLSKCSNVSGTFAPKSEEQDGSVAVSEPSPINSSGEYSAKKNQDYSVVLKFLQNLS